MKFKSIFNATFHHLSTVIFLFGFIFDAILLPQFDELIARLIGLTHICIVALFIYLREWVVARNTASAFEQKLFSLITFVISFSSGAALSFIFIYAVRSGEISASWPLFLMLLICMFANEFISTHNFRFSLDVGVLFIALLFYVIFNTPMILKVQSDFTFLLSLIVAAAVSLFYAHILKHSSYTASHEVSRSYALAVGIPMFVGMLYFLNMIPAVPLSLKEVDVYHSISREPSGDFVFSKEEKDDSLFSFFKTETHHFVNSDDAVYFYSVIDAPAQLSAPISHVWERYDNDLNKWVEVTKVTFDILGGREDGYRSYSKKENIEEGLWRVSVKVGETRVVGRKKFNLVKE